MKKKLLTLGMVVTMVIGLCACGGKETAGGLGSLDIEQQETGKDTVPDLNGGTNTPTNQTQNTETQQTPPPVEEPVPVGLSYEQYQGKYFSMMKPVGWDVWEYAFDDGTGNYRLMMSIRDPENTNNCIFLMTGLEPYFANETEMNKMAPWLPNPDTAIVLDPLNAESMALQFGTIRSALSKNGFQTTANHLPDWTITQSVLSNVSEESTDSMILSEFLGEATVGGDGKSYAAYFSNLLAKQYHAYLRCTYYISYANFGVCLEEDLWETDLDNVVSLANTYEQSGLNALNSSFQENEESTVYLPVTPSIDASGALE